MQEAALRLGGSHLLDLHCADLGNATHPSHYDYTSVYDLVIFRRLATAVETKSEDDQEAAVAAYHGQGGKPRIKSRKGIPAFHRIRSRAVGFIDLRPVAHQRAPARLLRGQGFRRALSGRRQVQRGRRLGAQPHSHQPADLVLRMVNAMVDSYLGVRKELA